MLAIRRDAFERGVVNDPIWGLDAGTMADRVRLLGVDPIDDAVVAEEVARVFRAPEGMGESFDDEDL
jgi:hypothetical protein